MMNESLEEKHKRAKRGKDLMCMKRTNTQGKRENSEGINQAEEDKVKRTVE